MSGRPPSAAGGSLGEELPDRAGLAGAEFCIALRDCRADLRVPDISLILQLVGVKLRNDGNRAAASFDFEFLPTLKTRAPQGGRGHNDRSFVFEGDGHGSCYGPTACSLSA